MIAGAGSLRAIEVFIAEQLVELNDLFGTRWRKAPGWVGIRTEGEVVRACHLTVSRRGRQLPAALVVAQGGIFACHPENRNDTEQQSDEARARHMAAPVLETPDQG